MKINRSVLISLLVGIALGTFVMAAWYMQKEARKEAFEHFEYGVISNSLVAENIVWNEYPQFRKVEFTLNGRLEITVPHGDVLSPEELQNPDALKEISRKSKCVSDGSSEIRYDEVVYEFADAGMFSNFPKIFGEPKQDATFSYQLSYPVEDGKVVVGYILPMDDEFKICTKEEAMFWECTQNIDLDFMTLSKTYVDESVLYTKTQNPLITVTKKESGVLDCSIKNEGDSVWQYSYMPVIEVWSQGVWLEIKSNYADPGVLQGCEAMQSCDITVPESALQGYPYLSPGLYRLVIYGDDGTYAATESFVIL